MSKKSSASLIWRATLLFAIFMGSSAFNFPTPKISQSLEVTCSRQAVFFPRCVDDNRDVLDSLRVANRATGSEQVQKSKKYIQGYENNNLPLIQSISVVVASRRISFLVLSIVLVNFVRSTILKIPKSEKFMFDECPWPFTAAHDPIKFIKDRNTHVVAFWAVLCQLYSLFNKARVVA